MKVFQVLRSGLFTTVQDMGRHGYLKYGVPVSGAMDKFSLVAANSLVGNKMGQAILEMTLIGPELQALTKTQIAVTGGSIPLAINEQDVPMWRTLSIQKDDVVSFGKVESGCRAYLSLRGGLNTPMILGSRSTYTRGGFGGISGRQLRVGDIIEGIEASPLKSECLMPCNLIPRFTENVETDVTLGPQYDMFTEEGINTFFSNQYKITPESDRMGYRLDGPKIEHKGKTAIVSDGLLPGAIQVPKNGKPIVLMQDAQTTGGYPKIAVVTTPDIDILGQAKPGNTIRFAQVTVQQAHAKILEYCKLLNNLSEMLIRK
jgi:biotin-dependent carboxylase-like uncharacterized protein